MSEEKRYNPKFQIYKPNNKDPNKGAASAWEWNPKTGDFFLTVAKQNPGKSESGNATFAWKDDSQIFKMSEWDIGEVIAVLSGRKNHLGFPDEKTTKGRGLFHQVSKGENAILKLYKFDNDSGDFGLELSTSKSGVRFWAGHRISINEAVVLQNILEDVIKKKFHLTSMK